MATYSGTSGNDTVTGATDQDNEFFGFGEGVDTLTGRNYKLRDIFHLSFGPGTDVIDGGAGVGAIDYSASTKGLHINLDGSGGTGTVRYVQSFTCYPNRSPAGPGQPFTFTTSLPIANLSGIEDVVGTKYGDQLTGSSAANVLDGGDGNDTINGLAGDDTLYGGGNNDTLFGGSGKNTIDAGLGHDTITLELENPTSGVTLFLDTIEGGEGTDTLLFEENLTGNFGVAVTRGANGAAGEVDSLRYTSTGFMDRSLPEAVITGHAGGGGSWSPRSG